jgi:hypothetical protein
MNVYEFNLIYKIKKPELIKARITVYNGGKYGRPDEFIAIIKPEYFKNGNIKKSNFTIIEKLQTIKQGYNFRGSAISSAVISEIIEIL